MEKIMVIVFDDETKAHHGIRALRNLDAEGNIAIHAGALIRKDQDGITVVPTSDFEGFPIGTISGILLGSAIGLLAGPAGLAVGAGAGGILGLGGDIAMATLDEDIVNEISKRLQPGKYAVVLDVDEEWITPVDTDLEPYSKTIFRRPTVDVEDELTEKRAAAYQKEMDNLEEEMAHARENQKVKIQARMEELRDRTRRQMDYLKQRCEQLRNDDVAKANILQQKVSTVHSNLKERAKDRVKELVQKDQDTLERIGRSIETLEKTDNDFTERVENSIARGLHKAAEHFEHKKAA